MVEMTIVLVVLSVLSVMIVHSIKGLASTQTYTRGQARVLEIADRIAQDVTRRALPELSFWVVRDPGATKDGDDGPQDDAAGESKTKRRRQRRRVSAKRCTGLPLTRRPGCCYSDV